MSYAILIILVFNIVGALRSYSTYQPTHLPTYPPTHLPTYPLTHLPTINSTMKLAPKVGLQTWWKCSVWSYIILMALLIMICKFGLTYSL